MPVFQHVGNAGGTAQIILQHVNLAVAMADQIGAGDVAPDPARRVQTRALRTKALRRGNDPLRHDAVADDFPFVVKVVDEKIQRPDALFQSAFDAVPLHSRDDAGHQVERQCFFHPGAFAVNVEGDAHLNQRLVGGLLARDQFSVGRLG